LNGLPHLEWLNLSENLLTHIPALRGLTHPEWLNLSGNPLTEKGVDDEK